MRKSLLFIVAVVIATFLLSGIVSIERERAHEKELITAYSFSVSAEGRLQRCLEMLSAKPVDDTAF